MSDYFNHADWYWKVASTGKVWSSCAVGYVDEVPSGKPFHNVTDEPTLIMLLRGWQMPHPEPVAA